MRFLVTGASGLLGEWVGREIARLGEPLVRWNLGRADPGCVHVDLTRREDVSRAFDEARPDVVLHLAARAAVADCAADPEGARATNALAVETLATACGAANARLVMVSTDLVFDGEGAPYDETMAPGPLSTYARTKLDGEAFALASPGGVVVRTSLLFGPGVGSRRGFFDVQRGALLRGERISLFQDEWRTPVALDAAARILARIARADVTGLVHLGGPERMSRVEMGVRLARVLGADEGCIMHVSRLSAGGEPRARDVSLDSRRLREALPDVAWPTYEDACREMLRAATGGS